MDYPRPTWAEFFPKFARRWKQGEHIFINGQTGSGKTELLLTIMELRSYVTVLVTKPKDPIFKSPLSANYERMREFKPTARHHRILLEAPYGKNSIEQTANQYATFKHALDSMYHSKGWAIGVDETLWIGKHLRLDKEVGNIAFMGRAMGLSVVAATQRPAHIPVIIPQSASHAFIAKTGRSTDLKTLAELGGDPRELEAAIKTLRDPHDFVYVDTQSKLPIQIVNTQR